MRHAADVAIMFAAVAGLAFTLSQCDRPQVRAAAAESTYLAQQLACVDRSATLEQSRACRADVRARWGVDGGAP